MTFVTRTLLLLAAIVSFTFQTAAVADEAIPVKLYKTPGCGCCGLHAQHLEENGFKVEQIETTALAEIKKQHGIPAAFEGCHTALINGYAVEGHVPASFIKQMLKEGKPVKGLALPGMPIGSPGMPGRKLGPLTVYVLDAAGQPTAYGSF